jgi:hypothetical protein
MRLLAPNRVLKGSKTDLSVGRAEILVTTLKRKVQYSYCSSMIFKSIHSSRFVSLRLRNLDVRWQ